MPGYDQKFNDALSLTLPLEGGYSNNPRDHGGATNKGITQVTYDRYRKKNGLPVQSVRNISNNEVSTIYFHEYWLKSGAANEKPPLDAVVFDIAVNSGPGRAIEFLAQIGPSGTPAERAMRLLAYREAFYNTILANDPSQSVFADGWMNRIAANRAYVNAKVGPGVQLASTVFNSTPSQTAPALGVIVDPTPDAPISRPRRIDAPQEFGVGSRPTVRITINGDVIDHEKLALTSCDVNDSDDAAGTCVMTLAGLGAVLNKRFKGDASVKVEYGWDEKYFAQFNGIVVRCNPIFNGAPTLTLVSYGPSFKLRDSNAPESISGTRADLCYRLIQKAGLKAQIRFPKTGYRSIVSAPSGISSWEALDKIAGVAGLIVSELGPDTIYVGPKDTQDFVYDFYYGTQNANVTEFEPDWSIKNRLKTIHVIGANARQGKRFVGTWTASETDEVRSEEVTLYVEGLKSLEAAEARAKAIGERNLTDSRSARLVAPLLPITNGQLIRVLGDVGRYGGTYYVSSVERQVLAGTMSLGLEWRA